MARKFDRTLKVQQEALRTLTNPEVMARLFKESLVDAEVVVEDRRGACHCEMNEPVEKVEKTHGGKRQGSGRKPLLDKAQTEYVLGLISQHGIEVDNKDLKKRIRLLRLLDVLYEKGVKKQDVSAIKEYLDRQLGKSKEHLDLTSKGKQIAGINYIRPDGNNTTPNGKAR